MDLLLNVDNTIAFIGENIEFGKLDKSEPNVDKWRISDSLFALGELILVQNMSVPDGVEPNKHRYIDGEFSLNPNWKEPVTIESLQQQITDLQLIIATLIEGGTV